MTSTDAPTEQPVQRKPLPERTAPTRRAPTLPPSPYDHSAGLSLDVSGTRIDTTSVHTSTSVHTTTSVDIRKSSDAKASSPIIGRLQKARPPSPGAPPVPGKEPLVAPRSISTSSPTETKAPLRLQKQRSSSVNSKAHDHPNPHSKLMPRPESHASEPRGRSTSAQPPRSRKAPHPENRVVSAAATASRPGSSNGSQSPTRDGERRGRLRRSWLPGGRSRSHSRDPTKSKGTTAAWILGQNVDYNTSFLANGERVPELWNENGDVFVYLDPKGSGSGPSFKVPAFATEYSLVFADLIEAEMTSPTSPSRTQALSFTGRDNLAAYDAERIVQSPPISPDFPESQAEGDFRLYLPVSMSTPGQRSESDLERMISIRNVFAFLTGQPLVATRLQPTLFSVFLNISSLLKEFEFTNSDGSTFGDAVEMSFGFFLEQTALADVRQSREKTLEALILGERMRSMELYNEAFAHAVGKYPAMRDLKIPLWEYVSPSTRQHLERAHFELVGHQNSVNNRLESFEFPALFSGVANSTALSEYKDVKFNTWRKSFMRFRQFVLAYYKANFGNWPPKARSKKNPFTESGLNRQVLKILYSDLCALYDLIVDRESLTTRVIDQSAEDIENDDTNPHVSAMRKVLGEFDHSSPPVLPPIPFDLPMLPSMTSVKENFRDLPHKEQLRREKNLQEYEMLLILNKAYDFETYKVPMPFLNEFKEFEHKEAKGKTASEMAEQRLGYWLFLYVVIQSLPMLVVDAPGLKFTEGVEYFLCQPPKGSPPWMEDAPAVRKRWYEVAGGGVVELSADAVEFSIEGIYHRSHCWLAAKQWERGEISAPLPPSESLSPLQAPQSVFMDMDPGVLASPVLTACSESPQAGPPGAALSTRTASPSGRQSASRRSIAFGLEPLALPPEGSSQAGSRLSSARGVSPGRRPVSALMNRSRSSGNLQTLSGPSLAHSRNTSRQHSVGGSTFDDILKDMEAKPDKKKRSLF